MSTLTEKRLAAERKNWRQDHPPGFFARPSTNADGSLNMMLWNCGIPGKPNTDWENGTYTLNIQFTPEYPTAPPKVQFAANFFHPNVYPSGTVCLSILNADKDWRPSLSVKDILLGIQDLLSEPNEHDPAQQEPFVLYKNNVEEYNKRVRAQVTAYPPP